MMIGLFHFAPDHYVGRIQTLSIEAEISIVPAPSSAAENAPEWRVLLGNPDTGVEIGAGWNRTGERASSFIAIQIDDPAFGTPLRANLLRSAHRSDEHHLLWSRPRGVQGERP